MNHNIWRTSDFFSMLWQIFAILCKAYLTIGIIVVLLFLFLMLISYIVVHDEFIEAINEAMKEFSFFDDSTLSYIIFFLVLSLFILFTYPIIIIGLLQSDD